jgi:hypothetical protein
MNAEGARATSDVSINRRLRIQRDPSMHHFLRRNPAMSTPNADSYEFKHEMALNVTTYVYDGYGELILVGDARLNKPRPVEPEPKVEVAYDRSRHVIKIKVPGGKASEFDDRPVRFLLMIRDPETKALKPVIEWGKPVYYYPAREVGGEKQAVGRGGVRARPRMNADRMGE